MASSQALIDPVSMFLEGAARHPLLTPAQELMLAAKIRGWQDWPGGPGKAPKNVQRLGQKARERFILSNLRLVASIARKFIGRGLDLEDLLQEGALGLNRAAEKFDHEKGYKFSTYATWWIRQSIMRGLSNQRSTIYLPGCQRTRIAQLAGIRKALHAELGRVPALAEVAERAELGIDQVRGSDSAAELQGALVSLDVKQQHGDGDSLLDLIASPSDDEGDELDVADMADRLVRVMPLLDEGEQQLLGLALQGCTNAEIGRQLGLKATTVSFRMARARTRARLLASRLGAGYALEPQPEPDQAALQAPLPTVSAQPKAWRPERLSLLECRWLLHRVGVRRRRAERAPVGQAHPVVAQLELLLFKVPVEEREPALVG